MPPLLILVTAALGFLAVGIFLACHRHGASVLDRPAYARTNVLWYIGRMALLPLVGAGILANHRAGQAGWVWVLSALTAATILLEAVRFSSRERELIGAYRRVFRLDRQLKNAHQQIGEAAHELDQMRRESAAKAKVSTPAADRTAKTPKPKR